MKLLRLVPVCLLALVSLHAQTDRGPLQLSLKRAIDLAASPEGNTNVQLAGEAVKQAEARSLQARAALLPNVDAAVNYQNLTRNLAAMGIDIQVPIPGFHIPTFVGPFGVVDARLNGTQNILDLASIRRYQASKTAVTASRSDADNAEDRVAAQVARAYLAGVKSDTDVETAQANVALSQAVLEQAQHQKTAGTGTGIEVTRANVQLANDRQRLLEAQNARRAAHLRLLRAIGLRLDSDVELTDRLQYIPVDAVTVEQAKALALRQRPDYQAQNDREATARLSASATRWERLPSVAAFGDYGDIGTSLGNALPTRTVGVSVRIPLFDGGRRDARRVESASQYRAEKLRTADLKEQIELDVRLALDQLQSAEDQVKVAREGLQLAENELTQARRRYEAGVANGIEVTDAQTRLARARDNQTTALYAHGVARVALAEAMGKARALTQ